MRGFFSSVQFSGRYSAKSFQHYVPMAVLMARLSYPHIILGKSSEHETDRGC